MNWFQQLLRKPAPLTNHAASLPGARPTGANLAALRAAWSSHRDDPDLAPECARQLGQALADAQEPPLAEDGIVVLVEAVCAQQEKTLALDWLDVLEEPEALSQVALRARYADVRIAAARRITDHATLEQLARESRGHDKSVYRHCADSLRSEREQAERQVRLEALAAAFSQLLQSEPVSVTRLLELDRELELEAPLPDDADPLVKACQDGSRAANDRARRDAECQSQLSRLRSRTESLLSQQADLHARWPGEDALSAWLRQAEAALADWEQLPSWTRAQTTARSLEASISALQQHHTGLAPALARMLAAVANLFTREAPADDHWQDARADWLASAGAPFPAWSSHLEAAWQGRFPLTAPVATGASAPASEAQTGIEADGAMPISPVEVSLVDEDALRALLIEFEEALDEGQFAGAEAVEVRIKALIGTASLASALEVRWQRAAQRLADLRGWARWGANKQREQMIEAARDLATGNHPVDHVGAAVPALRDAWKQLNSQGPASKAQWETFDTTLEKAFEPVLAYRAEQNKQRDAARKVKQAALADWEAWFKALDFATVSLQEVDNALRARLDAWRQLPVCGFRDERLLRKRVDHMKDAISKRLTDARTAEVDRRKALIAEARQLTQSTDLGNAIGDIKRLQGLWRSPPGAPRLLRGTEQKLWREFREICDAVFARRDAQRDEQSRQRKDRDSAAQALLKDFREGLSKDSATELRQRLARFEAELERHAADQAKPSPQWFRAASDTVRTGRERLAQLLQADKRKQWDDRIAAAAAPAPGSEAQARDRLASVLLDLEILLEIESPQQAMAQRRERQLNQLQERFRGAVARTDPVRTLRECCELAAVADAELSLRLNAVVMRVVALETERVRPATTRPPVRSARPPRDGQQRSRRQ